MGLSAGAAGTRHVPRPDGRARGLRRLWRRLRRQATRDARFREYLDAMGWVVDEQTGILRGEMAGWPLTAFQDAKGRSVVQFRAPAAMSPVVTRLRTRDRPSVAEHDGLTAVMTGDPDFDHAYEVRAAEPWFASLLLAAQVRQGLLSAPPQEWWIEDTVLTAVGPHIDDPLDLLARTGALAAVLESVPWQAYSETTVPPPRAAVTAALARQTPRLTHAQATALAQPD